MSADRSIKVICRWVPANASREELQHAPKTTMKLRVGVAEQVLMCYQAKRDADAPEGEARLLHELLLATATASLLSGSNKIVGLGAVSAPARKMHRGSCGDEEGHETASHVEGEFYFKCCDEADARCLLDKMQQAGCVMHGLGRRYEIKEQIGEGGYAKVFSAADKHTSAPVAIKLITVVSNGTHPLEEAAMLRRLRHPNLLDFHGVYCIHEPGLLRLAGSEGDHSDSAKTEPQHAWALVTELLDGKDLYTLSTRRTLKEAEARVVARQLLSALHYIHRSGIVHRDVKPENVVVTRKGVKLIDFGIASCLDDHINMDCTKGTIGYFAPEMFTGNREDRTQKMDDFAMGSLLYFVMCGRLPFVGNSSRSILANNTACKVDSGPLAGLSPEAAGFITELLEANPDDRMSASQAMLHPWLEGSQSAPRRDEEAGGSQDSAGARSAGVGGGGLAAIRSQ